MAKSKLAQANSSMDRDIDAAKVSDGPSKSKWKGIKDEWLAQLYAKCGEAYITQAVFNECAVELWSNIDFKSLKRYLLKNKLGSQSQLEDISSCPRSNQVDKLLSHVNQVGGTHAYFLLYVCLAESAEDESHQGHVEATKILQEKAIKMKVVAPEDILKAYDALLSQKKDYSSTDESDSKGEHESGYESNSRAKERKAGESFEYKCHGLCTKSCTASKHITDKECPDPEKNFPFLRVKEESYESSQLERTLKFQTRGMIHCFVRFVADTFQRLIQRKIHFSDVRQHVKRLVRFGMYVESAQTPKLKLTTPCCIKDTTNYEELEDVLCQNYCSWFNYDVLKEIREKFLFEDASKDEALKCYEDEFFSYCKRRCFESPLKLHPEPDSSHMKSLVFKIDEHFESCTLEKVDHMTTTVARIVNIPHYAIYVKSVREGCIEVSCHILPQHAAIHQLDEKQISELRTHKIISFKIEDQEILSEPEINGCESADSSDSEGYNASSEDEPEDFEGTEVVAEEGKRPEFMYKHVHPYEYYTANHGTKNAEVTSTETTTSTLHNTFKDEDADPSVDCGTGNLIGEGRFTFHLNLPEGLGLTSVCIVDGQPGFRFGVSPGTPATMEADIAAALRLAYEGKRPEFMYIPIPLGHPFYGRQFKQYTPQWLRGTPLGETFAEADWKMKCLHIGARSNDSMTEFWSWEKTSKLEGLATRFNFRKDKSHGSIIMSCNSVTVQESEDELRFVGEPRMRINDESNMRYSEYISKNFRAIAYHDEPLFLKMQELIKLVLAAEWLVEKGLKVDENWMMNHTRPQIATDGIKAIEGCGGDATIYRKPPSEMIPQPVDFEPPNRNVAVKIKEAKNNRSLAKQGIRRMYGWYDRGHNEGVMFTDDGTLLQQQRSMKMVRKITTLNFVDGKQTDETHERLFLRLPFNIPVPPISEMEPYFIAFTPSEDVHVDAICTLGHVSTDISAETVANEESIEMKRTRKIRLSGDASSPTVEENLTVTISVDDFDALYSNMDPNQPIRPEIPGKREAVIPNVQTWSELDKETVPWPHTWKTPAIDMGQPSASGGVSAHHIPVRREEARPRETVTETRSTWKDGFTRRGKELVVRGLEIARRAAFTILTGRDFETVAAKFRSAWHAQKGMAPTARRILAVTNEEMKRKWRAYKAGLTNKAVEEHFHGTALSCNVSVSQAPCQDGNCGVCGISCEGLNPQHIKKNIDFQRFGHGFYLAPHSSKCHDYTQGANGYRAMLLCDVCPGRKYKLEGNRQHLTGPPPGYDSVHGEVGSKLNYPEIVVYRPEAVLPRYIILYEKDGTQHPLSS